MAKSKVKEVETQAKDWIADLAEVLGRVKTNPLAGQAEQMTAAIKTANAETLVRLFYSLGIVPSGDGISAFSRNTEREAARATEMMLIGLLQALRGGLDRLTRRLTAGDVPAGYIAPCSLPKGSVTTGNGMAVVAWGMLPEGHPLRTQFPPETLPQSAERMYVICLGPDNGFGGPRLLYRVEDAKVASAEMLAKQRQSAILVRKFSHASNADVLTRTVEAGS